jgi:hypothetical protein
MGCRTCVCNTDAAPCPVQAPHPLSNAARTIRLRNADAIYCGGECSPPRHGTVHISASRDWIRARRGAPSDMQGCSSMCRNVTGRWTSAPLAQKGVATLLSPDLYVMQGAGRPRKSWRWQKWGAAGLAAPAWQAGNSPSRPLSGHGRAGLRQARSAWRTSHAAAECSSCRRHRRRGGGKKFARPVQACPASQGYAW